MLDAVTSAFTKGERSIATSQPLDTLQHRETSYFFHSVQFLVTEFCQKITGPDWIDNKNINVVRESWNYSYSSYVEARLIENSIYGRSIKEAAINKVEKLMKDIPDHHSREAAKWLLKTMLMGLEELSARLFDMVEDSVKRDGSFVSLCQTLQTLTILCEQKRLFALQETDQLEKLIEEAYYHAVTKIYEITKPNPDEINDIVEYLKFLYILSSKERGGLSVDIFKDQLTGLLSVSDIPPRLEGVITATYLQGVFSIARDVFLHDEQLLGDLNHLIGNLSYEDFLQIVPWQIWERMLQPSRLMS
nr:DUF5682 family protein [Brevibacillus laterosporus]